MNCRGCLNNGEESEKASKKKIKNKKQARKTKKAVKAMWNHIWKKKCETFFHFAAFTLNLEGFEADFREQSWIYIGSENSWTHKTVYILNKYHPGKILILWTDTH